MLYTSDSLQEQDRRLRAAIFDRIGDIIPRQWGDIRTDAKGGKYRQCLERWHVDGRDAASAKDVYITEGLRLRDFGGGYEIGLFDFLGQQFGCDWQEARRRAAAAIGFAWQDSAASAAPQGQTRARKAQRSTPKAVRSLGEYSVNTSCVLGEYSVNTTPRTAHIPARLMAMSEERCRLTPNALALWLRGFDPARADAVCAAYHLGNDSQCDAVFWYVDGCGRVVDGKIAAYSTARPGHRCKRDHGERERFGWVHATLRRGYPSAFPEGSRPPLPLYGSHLLPSFPSALVCIVESEKTALLAAMAMETTKVADLGSPCVTDMQVVWLASGGKQALRAEQLRELCRQGRNVIVCPDVDGIGQWSDLTAPLMQAERLHVSMLTPIEVAGSMGIHYETFLQSFPNAEHADLADILAYDYHNHNRNNTTHTHTQL